MIKSKFIKQCAILSIAATTCFAGTALSVNAAEKTPVIFDTDMAIDDWSALLLLAKTDSIDLLAVTANGVGETRCAPAMRNIPALLALATEDEIVIGCGDAYPIDGYFTFPEPWRQQADTLSGVEIADGTLPITAKHPVRIIHEAIENHEQKITLLATGSLTNIAQWIEHHPEDVSKVEKLVIMGGSFDTHGNIIVPGFTDGHPNKSAEWNIYVDAIAAAKVFSSQLNIEVVGLDVTNEVKVTTEFAKDFKKKAKTEAAIFWDKVLDDNDWFIDSGEYYFWDVLAALVVIDPSFCIGEYSSVTVSYDLIEKPSQWDNQQIPDVTYTGAKRKSYDPETFGVLRRGGDNKPAKICKKTKPKDAFTLFTETMNKSL